MPFEGGDPLRDGEDVLVMEHRPGCFVSTNYAAPPIGGAIQGHKNFRIEGAPDYIAGGERQEKGNWVPLFLQGGRGAKSYCGEKGCEGKRRGNRLGSFSSTGQWGPPSGGQGWAGGRRKDAVGRKDRTEGWRTGMVWGAGWVQWEKPQCGPIW